MIPTQPIQVTCPQCSQPFITQIRSIIDVGEQPDLKEQLLRGRFNVVRCPHCGSAGTIDAPLLYHDPEKELAFVLMPTALNLPRNEQEKLIGALTNALMDSLPPQKRRGYLFQPKTFLSLESLVKAVLEADGITPAMLEAHDRRLRLIRELYSRLDDEERFQTFVEEHQSEIDYELFLILSAMIDGARQDGQRGEAQSLDELRRRLLAVTGASAGPEPTAVEVKTFDDLLNVLQEIDSQEELQAVVATNRAVFDYAFFSEITERMDAARKAGDAGRADELRQLRQDILEAADSVDRATEAALQNAAELLRQILRAEDPRAAVRERLDKIDEAFLVVLAANIAQAKEQGYQDVADTLRDLYDFILDQIEEQMPPQARVINRLLRTETAEERARVLEAAGDAADGDLVKVLKTIAEDARAQGQTQLVGEFEELIKQVSEFVEKRT